VRLGSLRHEAITVPISIGEDTTALEEWTSEGVSDLMGILRKWGCGEIVDPARHLVGGMRSSRSRASAGLGSWSWR
jgi:hypothetical protein